MHRIAMILVDNVEARPKSRFRSRSNQFDLMLRIKILEGADLKLKVGQ